MAEDAAVIRSRANPLVRRVALVLAGKRRHELALEGDRLIADALGAGLPIDLVLVADDRPEKATELAGRVGEVVRVERRLLARVSGLKTSPGLIALCPLPAQRTIEQLAVDRTTLWLVIAGVSDPGNLGALARSAEAAGAGALVVVEGSASPWNEKALRGSMGSLLRLPLVRTPGADETARALGARGLRQCVAATRGGRPFEAFDWTGPLALWVGSETGQAPAACASMEAVTIPMARGVESLNVAAATSILLFAARRTGSV